MSETNAARLAKHPYAVALALLALGVLVYAFVVVRVVVLFAFFAVLFAVVLSYPVDWLARRMPRAFAVLITLAAFVGAIVAAVALAAPVVDRQLRQLMQRLPEAVDRIEGWVTHAGTAAEIPHGQEIAISVRGHVANQLAQSAAKALSAMASVASVVTGIVLLVALAFFLVSEPDSYRRGLRALVPAEHQATFDGLVDRLRTAIRKYMGGILVSMTVMGTLTAIGLRIAHIDGWFTLGLLTFFATFVPYAGAIASAIPGLAVGLAESPTKFFHALAVYVAVHVVEGYIVEPIIMKQAVTLRPAVLLLWQLVMGILFGILGIIVAAPTLACVKVMVEYLYIDRNTGKRRPASA